LYNFCGRSVATIYRNTIKLKGKIMEKVTLSTNLVNGIMQYLGTKPFAEVAQMIGAVQQEVQAQQTAQPSEVQQVAPSA